MQQRMQESQQRVQQQMEELRRSNLLGYSEKNGYKIQSSSGEEWERERRDIPVARDDLVDVSKNTGTRIDPTTHEVRAFSVTTDADGNILIPFVVPPNFPSAATLIFQYWLIDSAGPQGFAASNGLSGSSP